MKSTGKKHPPKKKHTKKPRPATIIPLTDEERRIKAQQQFDKALSHLNEAKRLAAWGEAPNACAHAAYYAMHHCAAAAILASGGVGKHRDVPKSHEHVIEHYGKLVESEGGPLGQSGRMLSRARTDRNVADYSLIGTISASDAAATTREARAFVDACAKRWAFRPSRRTARSRRPTPPS